MAVSQLAHEDNRPSYGLLFEETLRGSHPHLI